MSLLGWFSRRGAAAAARDSLMDSNLSRMEPTRPFATGMQNLRPDGAAGSAQLRPSAPSPLQPSRRPDRVEHREQLYSVVRESMVRSGVLSSSYKFKVLSLDSRNGQYLVMMDLAREYGNDSARLSEMEVLMAQTAKQRFGILVTAVYWRMNDHVAIGQPKTQQPHAAAAVVPSAVPVAAQIEKPLVATPVAQRFEPIQADEVEAFRKALAASVVTGHASPQSAKPAQTAAPRLHVPEPAKPRPKPWARRAPSHMTGYEDTEALHGEERNPGLSVTQYGELH